MVSNWLSLEPGETLHFDYQGDDGGALLLVSLQRQQGLDDDEPQLLQQPRRVHRTPTMGSGYSFFYENTPPRVNPLFHSHLQV